MPNCKPGDLAVFVRSFDGENHNLGKIIRVLEQIPTGGSWMGYTYWSYAPYGALTWRCGGSYSCVNDGCLKPLRGDIEDTSTEETKELVEPIKEIA